MKKSKYVNEHYLNMILQDPTSYRADYECMKEKVSQSEAVYQGAPVPFLYHPRFFTRNDVEAFKQISEEIAALASKVIQAYGEDATLRAAYGFPEALEALILKEDPLPVDLPMARYDIFYHSPKRYKFCEINTDGTSAMNEDRALVELFKESLAYDHFADEFSLTDFELFDSWADRVREMTAGLLTEKEPGLLILDNGKPRENPEFLRFQKTFEDKGYRVAIATPSEIEVRDRQLFVGEMKVDLVYRRLVTGDLMRHWDEYQAVVEALSETDVLWVGPLKSQVIHHKLFFAILHDKRFHHLFTPSEIKFIVAHIPYTARWNQAAAEDERFYEDKDHYIIKPFDFYGGKDVFTGRDLTAQAWRDVLNERIDRGYIIQEYVSLPRLPMIDFDEGEILDYGQITGIFVYGGKMQGIYSRAGRNNIITGSHEGRTLPTFTARRR